jgi:hypothetical protein
MTEADKIELLKTVPPRVELTRSGKFWRAVSWLCSFVAVVSLCVAVGAAVRAGQVAACTNDNLGTRSAPSSEDARAHIAFAQAIQSAFNAKPGQQKATSDALRRAVDAYVASLVTDQANRDAHPLGKC